MPPVGMADIMISNNHFIDNGTDANAGNPEDFAGIIYFLFLK